MLIWMIKGALEVDEMIQDHMDGADCFANKAFKGNSFGVIGPWGCFAFTASHVSIFTVQLIQTEGRICILWLV